MKKTKHKLPVHKTFNYLKRCIESSITHDHLDTVYNMWNLFRHNYKPHYLYVDRILELINEKREEIFDKKLQELNKL